MKAVSEELLNAVLDHPGLRSLKVECMDEQRRFGRRKVVPKQGNIYYKTSYRMKIMSLTQPRKFSTSKGGDLGFQVREDDAWMRSTAAINNNERESLFKVLAEKTQLSKLDLKGMHISSVYPLFQTYVRSHSHPYLSTSQVYLSTSTSQVCRSRQ